MFQALQMALTSPHNFKEYKYRKSGKNTGYKGIPSTITLYGMLQSNEDIRLSGRNKEHTGSGFGGGQRESGVNFHFGAVLVYICIKHT